MAKNSMDYSDIFCQAVQNIINGSFSNLKFDMSKECTVTKIINKSYGRYEVYDGSLSFEAVATEGSTYQVGDSVMVTIPQGDSNKQIIILNKIVDEWSGPAGFVRPLDTLVNCTGNIAFKKSKQQSLKANGKTSKINILTLTDQNFMGFQKIGIAASFRSTLNDIIKGDYGLSITIQQKSSDGGITPGPFEIHRFSCSDMLGNPYAFTTYFKQEYAFDIGENINRINSLTVDFYQSGDFTDGNGNKISSEFFNLFVKDLEIYLGYPQDREISEVVEIYSDSLDYNGNGPGEKQVYLQWIHKTDDYHLETITKDKYFNGANIYEVRWYQYTSGCDDSKTDEYGGKHWELLNRVKPSPASVNYPFELTINVRPTYVEEKVKAVCLVKTYPLTNDPTYEQIIRFDSNVLTFENLYEEAGEDAPPQEVLQKNLSLHFHDNSYGNYFLYDQNNRLIDGVNQGESYKRSVEIFYDGAPITQNADWYNSIQAISWEVPASKNNSMIYYDKYYSEDSFVEPNKNLIPDVKDNNNKANKAKWYKKEISKENYEISKSDETTNITIDKLLNETIYLTTEFDHTINGRFNFSSNNIKISINNVENIPENLAITLKMSIWIDDNDQQGSLNDNDELKWIWKDAQYQSFYLKNGQFVINSPSKLCSITENHKKVMIGLGFIFNKDNEDFNKFIADNPNVEFKLSLEDDTTINFVTQSEYYTNTTYPTIDDNGNRQLNTIFNYSISSVWYKDRSNNAIRCRITIDNKNYLLQEELQFGTQGSNGTKNTLHFEILDSKNALEFDGDKTLKIEAILVKSDNQRVYLDSDQITWELLNDGGRFEELEKEGSIVTLKLKVDVTTVPSDNYTILKASVKYESDGINPVLEAYMPIPIKTSKCVGISGTKEVVYNSQGVPPPYDNDTYVAYIKEKDHQGNDIITEKYQLSDDNNDGIGWACEQSASNPNPVGLKSLDSRVALQVSPLYSKKDGNPNFIQDEICVYYINSINNNEEPEIVWSQPILIMQSSYDFAMLNSWDGKLTINKDNGTILSTMLGAGKKNSQNQFSGVLLGDVETGTGNTVVKKTGVYGFKNGTMTYALKEDGTGFFGGSGNGRIEFDGINGTISSSGWTESNNSWSLNRNTGTLLDLSNGKLIMKQQHQATDENEDLLYNEVGQPIMIEDSYFKFNEQGMGKLEMALSGLNVKLTDKDNSPNLSGYIDITAQGLTSEFRRGATYTAICNTSTENATKSIPIENFKQYFDSFTSYKAGDYTINKLSVNDILQDGVTIAITFTEAETVDSQKLSFVETVTRDGVRESRTIGYCRKNTGKALYLKIGNYSRPIYVNGKETNDIPSIKAGPPIEGKFPEEAQVILQGKINENKPLSVTDIGHIEPDTKSNSYGWEAGSIIYFTYYKKLDENENDIGYWEVSDGGNYSRITQTEKEIRSEVTTANQTISSSITQTADSIRLEVARKAGYSGTVTSVVTVTKTTNSSTTETTYIKVKLDKASYDSIDEKKGFAAGDILQITFNCDYSGEPVKSFQFYDYNEKNEIKTKKNETITVKINPNVTWKKNETLAFIYTQDESKNWCFTKTTLSYSQIKMLNNMISAFVTDDTLKQSFGWKLTPTQFSLISGGNGTDNKSGTEVFKCDQYGIYVEGEIVATSGEIGNFSIKDNALQTLYKKTTDEGEIDEPYITYTLDENNNLVPVKDARGGVYVGTDFISLGPKGGFQVNNDGTMYAKKGQIGPLNISTDSLKYGLDDKENPLMVINTNGIKLGPTYDDGGNLYYNFSVNTSGELTAYSGTFTGKIEGGSGYFSGEIYASNISNANGGAQIVNVFGDSTETTQKLERLCNIVNIGDSGRHIWVDSVHVHRGGQGWYTLVFNSDYTVSWK